MEAAFIMIDNGASCSCSDVTWAIQNNCILFNGNPGVTKITVQTLSLVIDNDGYPLVSESAVNAIVEYIQYKYCVRSRYGANKMDQFDVELHLKQWELQSAKARSEDAEMTDSEREPLVAMLTDPLVGYGTFTNNIFLNY